MGYCRVCEASLENNIYKGQHGICKRCDNQRHKEYYITHPENAEKHRIAFRKHYAKHRDEVQQHNCKWKDENPERNALNRRHQNKLRKYRMKNAEGSFTRREWEDKLKAYDFTCAYCRQLLSISNITVDHVVPLSKGGTNYIENLVPSCLDCNCKKHAKILPPIKL